MPDSSLLSGQSLLPPAASWTLFLLIVCRLGTVVAVSPVFGQRGTPPAVKVALTLVLAFAFLPLVGATPPPPANTDALAPHLAQPLAGYFGSGATPASSTPSFLVLVGREVLIGGVIGLAILLIFNALMAAGQIVGLQMGFSLGSILNPMHNEPIGPIDNFYALLATAVFFAIDGHQLVLLAVQRSFDLAPLGTLRGSCPLCGPLALPAGPGMLAWGGELFLVGVQMALPVAGALFLADIALALVSRALPQLNVFVLGAPAKIAVGLFMLAATLPATLLVMSRTFGALASTAARLLGQG